MDVSDNLIYWSFSGFMKPIRMSCARFYPDRTSSCWLLLHLNTSIQSGGVGGAICGQVMCTLFPIPAHLHTSLPLENVDERMTSGAIQAYVPAALILVVRCHSRARPKSVIFRVLLPTSSVSAFSRIRTGAVSNGGDGGDLVTERKGGRRVWRDGVRARWWFG